MDNTVLRLPEMERNDMSIPSLFLESQKTAKEARFIIGYYGFWVQLTYLSVISAALGMHFALGGNIGYALICLMASGVCDTLDGRVASMKKRNAREKNYGIQIDSLADIISFGVLPAVIGYAAGSSYSIQNYGPLGMAVTIIIVSLYLLAALIRLAYFNVIETELQSRNEKRKYYEGLPVTSVALIFPAAYALCDLLHIPFFAVYAVLTALVSVAFVLKIKIPKPRGRSQIAICLMGIPVVIYIFLSGLSGGK
ncbi:MAG: CDP-alcohol phosphatidyltransferase [Firmicutes bacterium ADurb.Bin248]|jgi:CDP-diacylglycerol--serine O-phosphatidyltransferase|nr:MAG: CDP-alcohol phosphatidyltransferase [Firmicutes bacterium ADurb.Bin248]